MQKSPRPTHSKSRNGCLRCKARKIKCDETKPSCTRCATRNFHCPGYALDVRWSRKHEVRSGAGPSELVQQPEPVYYNAATDSVPEFEHEIDLGIAPGSTVVSSSHGDLSHALDYWGSLPPPWDFKTPAPGIPGSLTPPSTFSFAIDQSSPSLETELPDFAWTVLDDNGCQSTNEPSGYAPEGDREIPAQARVLSTCPQFSAAPREIFSMPTALSDYFFRDVIALYCLWDSKSNDMRNIIENTWQSSVALQHTVRSMAAACLSGAFPKMRSVALSEHTLARRHVQKYSPSLAGGDRDAMLLAATLLGHTSTWLFPQNLATDMFKVSCAMLGDMARTTKADQGLWSFFSGTMDYWAMLLVYLTDSHQLDQFLRWRRSLTNPETQFKNMEAHPYCGLSHEMIQLLTEIGGVIFRHRKHMSAVKFLTESDTDAFKQALREGRRLERTLLAHRLPESSAVVDPGDPRTPLRHLELIDEAYRCTGLLQLYRVFPDLLNERYAPWSLDRLLRPTPMGRLPTSQERQEWLTKLAIHILDTLQEIPFESRTISAQPFLLVAACSELRMDTQPAQCSTEGETSILFEEINSMEIEVFRNRKFVSSRLAAYTHIMPLPKNQTILELVSHVFTALDSGQDVYWLDIALEKHLGTMMG